MGTWIDFHTGEPHSGPEIARVPAPLETLPLFVRAGSVLPMLTDPWTSSDRALALHVYPGGATDRTLPDGTRMTLTPTGSGTAVLRVSGPNRAYTMRLPHHPRARIAAHDRERSQDGSADWQGDATLTLVWE